MLLSPDHEPLVFSVQAHVTSWRVRSHGSLTALLLHLLQESTKVRMRSVLDYKQVLIVIRDSGYPYSVEYFSSLLFF